MKLLIVGILCVSTLAYVSGGKTPTTKTAKTAPKKAAPKDCKTYNDVLEYFKSMEPITKDVEFHDNWFDMERVLDLYDYAESDMCGKDLSSVLNTIVEQIRGLGLAFEGVNLDAGHPNSEKEPTPHELFVKKKSFFEGAKATPHLKKLCPLMNTLYAGHQKYEANLLKCYDHLASNYTPKSIEINVLVSSLADVLKPALKANTAIDSKSTEEAKKIAQHIINKLNDVRTFMNSFIGCAEKEVTTMKKQHHEFNTKFNAIK
ncbi:uncharacterized protein LOC116341463 [Contarinia nasturtii]|uniref:uncharacterized protein LOC116341463 n=1 Tax=Contarinia nasturtii TaxID=265458 RepID=UPI0012D3A994|nr:uncharacterized protein LOC116341463 [Contarinia nasturtii]